MTDFPYSLCASVNENIVHGYPSNYILKEGDILKLDLGVLYKGFNTDMAITVAVGKVSFEAKRLINVTKKSLRLGIKKAKVGNTIGDIGNTVQRFVEDQGFGVVEIYAATELEKICTKTQKFQTLAKEEAEKNWLKEW